MDERRTDNRSVLAGCESNVTGELHIQQRWKQLLIENPGLLHQPALIVPALKNPVTFGELDRRSTALANKLWALYSSVRLRGQDDWIISVSMAPSDELIVTLLAIFKLGAAYLPIDPSFPKNRVIHILEDAKPSLIITSKALRTDVGFDHLGFDIPIFCYDDNVATEHKENEQFEFHSKQDLAVVLYTSGSTGTPKGVRLTHRNIIHRLSWQWRVFPYQSDEVCCFKTALTFVDSIAEVWAPLLKGIPVVVVTKQTTQDTIRFISLLDYHHVTRLVLVPSLLSSIIAHSDDFKQSECPLAALKLWVCSGEVLTAQLLRQFFKHLRGTICNFYGSTEITGDVSYATFSQSQDVESQLHDEKVPLGNFILSYFPNVTFFKLKPKRNVFT